MCKNLNILFLFFTLFLFSCTSSVRFTSNKQAPKKEFSKKENRKSKRKSNLNSDKSLDPKSHKEDSKNHTISPNNTQDPFKKIIIEKSKEWLGTPYRYGGRDHSGIDCSAFVQNVFKETGIELPRTAQHQFEFSTMISRSKAEIGDLVFFRKTKKITHVGIYMGDDKFIHSSTSNGVIFSSLNDTWYSDHFHSIGRIKF